MLSSLLDLIGGFAQAFGPLFSSGPSKHSQRRASFSRLKLLFLLVASGFGLWCLGLATIAFFAAMPWPPERNILLFAFFAPGGFLFAYLSLVMAWEFLQTTAQLVTGAYGQPPQDDQTDEPNAERIAAARDRARAANLARLRQASAAPSALDHPANASQSADRSKPPPS